MLAEFRVFRCRRLLKLTMRHGLAPSSLIRLGAIETARSLYNLSKTPEKLPSFGTAVARACKRLPGVKDNAWVISVNLIASNSRVFIPKPLRPSWHRLPIKTGAKKQRRRRMGSSNGCGTVSRSPVRLCHGGYFYRVV
jgi:hypothetical protein